MDRKKMIELKSIVIERCLTCAAPLHPQRIRAMKTHCARCEPMASRTRAVQVEVPNRAGLLRPVLVREVT